MKNVFVLNDSLRITCFLSDDVCFMFLKAGLGFATGLNNEQNGRRDMI